MVNLPHKNSKPLLIKILTLIKIIKMIMMIIITKIIKCRGICRIPTATNMELFVTLYNDRKPSSNIKKSFSKML